MLLFREGHLGNVDDASVMAKELEAAISLDPGSADSYALLAFAQMTSGDSAKALSTMQKALEIDPRNQNYLYNLANLYLANRQPNQAIAILGPLRVTDNPVLASQVAAMLAQARQFKQAIATVPNASGPSMVVSRNKEPNKMVPQENEISPSAAPSSASPASAAPAKKDTKWGSPKFIHGILNSVDCSPEPAAVLTLLVGAKTLKMSVPDRNHVIVIGSEQFSCSWIKRKVAVNYRESDTGETSVMSVELQ